MVTRISGELKSFSILSFIMKIFNKNIEEYSKPTRQSLEQSIRYELGQRKRDRLQKYFDSHPEIANIIDEAHQKYMDKIHEEFDNYQGEAVDKDEFGSLVAEMIEPVTAEFKQLLSIEALLERATRSYSKDADTLRAESEAGYEKLNAQINDDEDFQVDLTEIKEELDEFIEHASITDEFVNKVVDFAEIHGIEAALKDNVIRDIDREIFSTKEEYLKYEETQDKLLKKMFRDVGKTINGMITGLIEDADEEEAEEVKHFAKLFSSLFSNLFIYTEAYAEMMKPWKHEAIEKIYSSK